MFLPYFVFVFTVIHSAVGFIVDPASISSKKPPIINLLTCGLRHQLLRSVNHRMAMTMHCQEYQNILTQYVQDKRMEKDKMRSSLPTSRPCSGWNRETPTFVENVYRILMNEIPENQSPRKNVAVSPLGLGMGLAALSHAAAGDTKREILQALGLTAPKLVSYYSAIITPMEKQEELPVKIVSKLYLDQSFMLESSLKSKIQYFRTKTEKANFQRLCNDAVKNINKVVEEETGETVKDAVVEGDTVNKDTVLLLLGVFYVHWKWQTPFQTTKRFNGDFKISEEDFVQATYMSMVANKFFYKEVMDGEYKMLELPYTSGTDKPPQFSLIIILPEKVNGIFKLHEVITKDHSWLKNFDIQNPDSQVLIKPTIPRFTIDVQMEYKNILNKLGINIVFGNSANLEDICKSNPIKLSAVQQKVYFKVDEKDMNSGALTVAIESAETSDNSVKTFVADHPFAFALIQRSTKTVLLIGDVLQPEFDPK